MSGGEDERREKVMEQNRIKYQQMLDTAEYSPGIAGELQKALLGGGFLMRDAFKKAKDPDGIVEYFNKMLNSMKSGRYPKYNISIKHKPEDLRVYIEDLKKYEGGKGLLDKANIILANEEKKKSGNPLKRTLNAYLAPKIDKKNFHNDIISRDEKLIAEIKSQSEAAETIELPVPEDLNDKTATLLAFSCMMGQDYMKKSFERTLSDKSGSNNLGGSDPFIIGFTNMIDNMFSEVDQRANMHTSLIFLPDARNEAANILNGYVNGDKESLAKKLKYGLDLMILECKSRTGRTGDNVRFMADTAIDIAAVLNSPALRGTVELDDDEKKWIKLFTEEKKLITELDELKSSMNRYAMDMAANHYEKDPKKDFVLMEMVRKIAARQTILDRIGEELRLFEERDTLLGNANKHEQTYNRDMLEIENNLLSNPNKYKEAVELDFETGKSEIKKLNAAKTYLDFIGKEFSDTRTGILQIADYNNVNVSKIIEDDIKKAQSVPGQDEVIDKIRNLCKMTEMVPKKPTIAQINDRIKAYREAIAFLEVNPIMILSYENKPVVFTNTIKHHLEQAIEKNEGYLTERKKEDERLAYVGKKLTYEEEKSKKTAQQTKNKQVYNFLIENANYSPGRAGMLQKAIAINKWQYRITTATSVTEAANLFQNMLHDIKDGNTLQYNKVIQGDPEILDVCIDGMLKKDKKAEQLFDSIFDLETLTEERNTDSTSESTLKEYFSPAIDKNKFFSGIVKGNEKLKNQIFAARDEAAEITIPVTGEIDDKLATYLTLSCFVEEDHIVKSYEATLKDESGSTMVGNADPFNGGMDNIVENMFNRDSRANMHTALLFLPESRTKAAKLINDYSITKNPQDIALKLKYGFDKYLNMSKRLSGREVKGADAARILIEMADLLDSPLLKGTVELTEEEKNWVKYYREEIKLIDEVAALKEEIGRYALEKDAFHQVEDPNRDPVFMEKMNKLAARKRILNNISVNVAGAKNIAFGKGNGSDDGILEKREMTEIERNFLNDPEGYKKAVEVRYERGKYKIERKPDSFYRYYIANTNGSLIDNKEGILNIPEQDNEYTSYLLNLELNKAARDMPGQEELIAQVRELPVMKEKMPENPTEDQVADRIKKCREAIETISNMPLKYLNDGVLIPDLVQGEHLAAKSEIIDCSSQVVYPLTEIISKYEVYLTNRRIEDETVCFVINEKKPDERTQSEAIELFAEQVLNENFRVPASRADRIRMMIALNDDLKAAGAEPLQYDSMIAKADSMEKDAEKMPEGADPLSYIIPKSVDADDIEKLQAHYADINNELAERMKQVREAKLKDDYVMGHPGKKLSGMKVIKAALKMQKGIDAKTLKESGLGATLKVIVNRIEKGIEFDRHAMNVLTDTLSQRQEKLQDELAELAEFLDGNDNAKKAKAEKTQKEISLIHGLINALEVRYEAEHMDPEMIKPDSNARKAYDFAGERLKEVDAALTELDPASRSADDPEYLLAVEAKSALQNIQNAIYSEAVGDKKNGMSSIEKRDLAVIAIFQAVQGRQKEQIIEIMAGADPDRLIDRIAANERMNVNTSVINADSLASMMKGSNTLAKGLFANLPEIVERKQDEPQMQDGEQVIHNDKNNINI